MRKTTARIKGVFFVTRHANHHIVHILLGMLWFFLLDRTWHNLTLYHFGLAILGSELPDFEHLYYFYIHGRHDDYSIKARLYIKNREWRTLTLFLENNHKSLTTLRLHSLIWIFVLMCGIIVSFASDQFTAVVLLGSMLSHYCFDIVDDFLFLGHLNPNWFRGIRVRGER